MKYNWLIDFTKYSKIFRITFFKICGGQKYLRSTVSLALAGLCSHLGLQNIFTILLNSLPEVDQKHFSRNKSISFEWNWYLQNWLQAIIIVLVNFLPKYWPVGGRELLYWLKRYNLVLWPGKKRFIIFTLGLLLRYELIHKNKWAKTKLA